MFTSMVKHSISTIIHDVIVGGREAGQWDKDPKKQQADKFEHRRMKYFET